ncbi:MAG: hypothetical protein QF894_07705 [Alphaproteobacteria bacterium]|jgi:hypothetical protein|nr:hypothetical protein [Alphaproteobacteria bacterium]|tara:strand:+ start:333 stop:992 length:660 start_codon:yes stop_codon:yes gene_type:complete
MNWRKIWRVQVSGLLGVCFLASSGARGGELAAIVEDLSPGVSDIGLFDYLSTGAVVNLADGDWIRLGYLRSCAEETITGGTVLIRMDKSAVIGGTVERRAVECDGGNLQLTSDQSDQAGAAVMREQEGDIEVALTVHGASPYFRIMGAAQTLELESLDRPRETQTLKISANGLDLAEHGIALRKGGLYRARAAGREIVFRVDKLARPGAVALLSRLVPL